MRWMKLGYSPHDLPSSFQDNVRTHCNADHLMYDKIIINLITYCLFLYHNGYESSHLPALLI